MTQTPTYPSDPTAVFVTFWRHRHLIWQMGKRQVFARYRGSVLGLFWSILQPLVMLAIYAFVFGYVFQARFGTDAGANKPGFAEMLFAGLIVHAMLADTLMQAPRLVLSNPSFVKRVVFPLETLSWSAMVSTTFHTLISILVLLAFYGISHGSLQWTIIFVPVVLAPYIILSVGISWFMSALGVYLRDLGEVVSVLVTLMLFGSPVFYPLANLPPKLQLLLMLNPITIITNQMREVVLRGQLPSWRALAVYLFVSIMGAWIGLLFFQRARRGFADVI